MYNNNIAIEITEKIHREMLSLICEVGNVDATSVYHCPSYYQIRNLINNTLDKYFKLLSVDYNFTPAEMSRIPDQSGYAEHVKRYLASQVCEQIFEKEMYNLREWSDKNSLRASRTFTVGILDYSKLERET